MKITAVFDTNIYISAFAVPGGRAEEAYLQALKKKFILYSSIAILAETAQKLEKKFGWSEEKTVELIKFISRTAAIVKTKPHIKVLRDDPDNRILECALKTKAAYIGSKPEIWRRVLVSGNTTLARLHKIIQELMGWEDDHLHEFVIAGTHYTKPHPDDLVPSEDEKGVHLFEAAPREGQMFLYIYDFGDNWEHVVLVEKILDDDPRFAGKPVCIGGANAGPPEDSGGIPGYYEMLEAVKDKRHPEHEEIKEWLGDFDPRAFDMGWINRVLSRIR